VSLTSLKLVPPSLPVGLLLRRDADTAELVAFCGGHTRSTPPCSRSHSLQYAIAVNTPLHLLGAVVGDGAAVLVVGGAVAGVEAQLVLRAALPQPHHLVQIILRRAHWGSGAGCWRFRTASAQPRQEWKLLLLLAAGEACQEVVRRGLSGTTAEIGTSIGEASRPLT
jgi:hypothetical protein